MASEMKPKQSKPKGILKASTSFDKPDHHPDRKEMKWDEMNILATHHPADKDYGHMKIDEPKTPYNRMSDAEDDDELGGRRNSVSEEPGVDPESVASRLADVDNKLHARLSGGEEDDSSTDEEETEDERAKRKFFEQKRKLHYNEFQAVRLAKQLMEEENDEDEDNDEKVQDQNQKLAGNSAKNI